MTYDSDHYIGPITIKPHLEASSATVFRHRKIHGQLEEVPAVNFLSSLDDWVKRNHPGTAIVRVDGPRFYWAPINPEAATV